MRFREQIPLGLWHMLPRMYDTKWSAFKRTCVRENMWALASVGLKNEELEDVLKTVIQTKENL